MLFDAVESAYICGRCAARTVTRRHRAGPPRLSSRFAFQCRSASTSTAAEQEIEVPIKDDAPHDALPRDQPAATPKEQYDVHLRVSGKTVRHKRATLGVPRLGKPAQILIVDEEPARQRKHRSAPITEPKEQTTSIDEAIKDVIQEIDHQLTPGEVNANIDNVRKAVAGNKDLVTTEQREELLKNLSKGFSRLQLHYYATSVLGIPQNVQTDDGNAARPDTSFKAFKGLLKTSNWNNLARISDAGRSKKEKQTLVRAIGMAGKPKMVSLIVDKLWKLKILGKEEAVDFAIEENKAKLLKKVSSTQLQGLLRKSGARFEIIENGTRVKIIALSDRIDVARAEIQSFLDGNIVRHDMDIVRLSRSVAEFEKAHDDDMIRYLNQKYDVVVKNEPGSKRSITSYRSSQPLVNHVVKEMYMSRQPQHRSESAAIWAGSHSNVRKVNMVCGQENSWSSRRMKDWGRWVAPYASDQSTPTAERAGLLAKDMLKRAKVLPKVYTDVASTTGVYLKVSAALGQTLSIKPKDMRHADSALGPSLKAVDFPSLAFSREYPRLPQILSTMTPGSISNDVEMTLAPAPITKHRPEVPDIHLRLSPTERNTDGRPKPLKAQAVLSQTSYNLLLPQLPVDVRFDVQLCYDLLQHEPDFVNNIMTAFATDRTTWKQSPALFALTVPSKLVELWASANPVTGEKKSLKASSTSDVSTTEEQEVHYLASSSALVESRRFVHQKLPLNYAHYTALGPGQSQQWNILKLEDSPASPASASSPDESRETTELSSYRPSAFLSFTRKVLTFVSSLA